MTVGWDNKNGLDPLTSVFVSWAGPFRCQAPLTLHTPRFSYMRVYIGARYWCCAYCDR